MAKSLATANLREETYNALDDVAFGSPCRRHAHHSQIWSSGFSAFFMKARVAFLSRLFVT